MTLPFARYCWALLLLLASGLGACQRGGYQFQDSVAPTCQLLKPAFPVKSAVAVLASASIVLPSKSYRQQLPTPHRRVQRVQALRSKASPLLVLQAGKAAARLTVSAPDGPPLPPDNQPLRHRSRGIAVLLALLSITYIPLSLHNFYLGYYGRGAAAVALLLVGLSLVVLGWNSFPFGAAGLAPIGYVGLLMLAGWLLWQ